MTASQNNHTNINNKTCIVHIKKHPYDVNIGRPSIYGNLWSHKEDTKALFKTPSVREAILNYKAWLYGTHYKNLFPEKRQEILGSLHKLRGKKLACWCVKEPIYNIREDHEKICHGEVLLEIIILEKYNILI